jgi:hypothetical protein
MKAIIALIGLLAISLFSEVITEIEPNDTYEAPGIRMVTNCEFEGEISTWDDRDWWRFRANKYDVVEITPNFSEEIGIWLFTDLGDDGPTLAMNNPGFGTLTYEFDEPGVYMIQVAPYNTYGAYNYTVSGSSAIDDNTPPIIFEMPDRLVPVGETFPTLNLDDFVIDPQDPIESLTWYTEGNDHINCIVSDDRVMSFEVEESWSGSEYITFVAEDPLGGRDKFRCRYTVATPIVDLYEDFNQDQYNLPEDWKAYGQIYINQSEAYSGNCVKFVADDGMEPVHLVTPLCDKDSDYYLNMKIKRGNLGPINYIIGTMTDYFDLSTFEELEIFTTDSQEWDSIANYHIPPQSDEYHIVIKQTTIANYHNLFVDNVRITKTVDIDESITPETNTIVGNYPNPFNPTTEINFVIGSSSDVQLAVYNSKGEFVKSLLSTTLNSGNYTQKFDGSSLNSGVYYSVLSVNGVTKSTAKMVLVK